MVNVKDLYVTKSFCMVDETLIQTEPTKPCLHKQNVAFRSSTYPISDQVSIKSAAMILFD